MSVTLARRLSGGFIGFSNNGVRGDFCQDSIHLFTDQNMELSDFGATKSGSVLRQQYLPGIA